MLSEIIFKFLQRNVSPLEVAVESMQDVIKKLTGDLEGVEHLGGREVKPLSARLQGKVFLYFHIMWYCQRFNFLGMLHPAIMGGIAKYEEVSYVWNLDLMGRGSLVERVILERVLK